MKNPMLEVQNLSVNIQNKTIIENITFEVMPGEVLAVLGPNGAGKSTLFSALTGERLPATGQVLINQQPLSAISDNLRATQIGVLPQSSALSFAFSCYEVVSMGRIPWATGKDKDAEIIQQAMEQVDAWHLCDRIYTSLSGGEKQRIHLARVIAQITTDNQQAPRLLLLDEPTSALDPSHQHLTLQLARQLTASNTAVLVILHDFNLAARYADKIMVIKEGKQVVLGEPPEVLKPGLIKEVFDIESQIINHPTYQVPVVLLG
ncbi:heme ABC transporter ATP-binding protein [Spartinivicinus marinus]|nr:heme ABC transporter ATP-binding protein [Spartinivicinus marinus]MCX4026332.1 heme ABC transporter ATP-binding protein [Spartinivicinus marinus]